MQSVRKDVSLWAIPSFYNWQESEARNWTGLFKSIYESLSWLFFNVQSLLLSLCILTTKHRICSIWELWWGLLIKLLHHGSTSFLLSVSSSFLLLSALSPLPGGFFSRSSLYIFSSSHLSRDSHLCWDGGILEFRERVEENWYCLVKGLCPRPKSKWTSENILVGNNSVKEVREEREKIGLKLIKKN